MLDVVPLQVADTKRMGLCIEPLSNYDLKSKKMHIYQHSLEEKHFLSRKKENIGSSPIVGS